MIRILKESVLYLISLAAITAVVYYLVFVYGEKTFHLEKKQWRPATPESQNIDPARLSKALEYADTRLPTARSLMLLRNGKTVVEQYYWRGGPKVTDYLHSLNLPLLQVLIGIAIDQQLVQGPEQPLSDFFPKYLNQTLADDTAPLTLNHLLSTQAPLLWGDRNPDYWALFHAGDRIKASLQIISRHQTDARPSINFAAAHLLSHVIERVSGQSVFSFAYRYLFQPLGITTYEPNDDDLPRDPMVGFQLKALDLAKIGYLLAREGSWDGRRIVSREWVRGLFYNIPQAEFGTMPGGNWVRMTVRGHEILAVRGDGGQYLVLAPALNMVMVATSNSRFVLSQDNGRNRLLQLIMAAVLEPSDTTGMVTEPEQKSEADSVDESATLDPNYVFSTPVPQDMLDFFNQFAQDIASKNIPRIVQNYARAYENDGRTYASLPRRWMRMFGGGPGHLQYVHITKIRIENNRAYLRGNLKYAYMNMMTGSIGLFPLENLIKIKGRWKWLGLPEKTAVLDRDDYFDAELSEQHQQFIDNCSDALVGESRASETECFTETFLLAGGGAKRFAERLQPFLKGRSGGKLHVTRVQPNGTAYRVEGYIEGTALGDLRLPEGLHIVKENGAWKWQGLVD